jgi:uncharacterized protein (DUF433 family)
VFCPLSAVLFLKQPCPDKTRYNSTQHPQTSAFIGETMFHWITFDPKILNGKPHIRGTRLSIEFIMELFASGGSRQEIVQACPQLTLDAIDEALRYAAKVVKNEILLTTEIV